jgi:hypothetical protein
MQSATCAARYDRALLELADAWDAWGFEARMDALLVWVRAEVESDPRREYDMYTHDSYVAATRTTMQTSADNVRAAVAAR